MDKFIELIQHPVYKQTLIQALSVEINDCEQHLQDYLSTPISDKPQREIRIGNLTNCAFEYNVLVEMFNSLVPSKNQKKRWKSDLIEAHKKRLTPKCFNVV